MGWGFVVEGCVSDIQIYTKDQNYLFFIFILLKYLLHVDNIFIMYLYICKNFCFCLFFWYIVLLVKKIKV